MNFTKIDSEGNVKCPKCGTVQHFSEGTEKSEYTGGGYQDIWFEFFCPSCDTQFRSEEQNGYI